MRELVEKLSQYAAYHRDRRNILTHFIGIPLIVLAVSILLSRPAFVVAGVTLSPALLLAAWVSLYYLRLDTRYGLVMTALLALCVTLAAVIATWTTMAWSAIGLGLFVVGWVFQFVGHYYEGRKPAFVDDLVGLIIGPLFVVAEAGFLLGLRKDVQARIEQRLQPE
ncbi:DUF962 domain-containing protein [Pseudomonas sp. ABC1]|uniref:Mpo1 family 2-hydroxy fatty acid dioxygenase n=1 Tax=Pseudomonas sp. ABC1 TaxID=2748080 RepID=UPI0015C338F4|nr:Mpo1-like protein [Pseudomonas sp. ABC1]QLF92621.1 DUF962 domain-containing protein [Pseudomonas sp. ABC1]